MGKDAGEQRFHIVPPDGEEGERQIVDGVLAGTIIEETKNKSEEESVPKFKQRAKRATEVFSSYINRLLKEEKRSGLSIKKANLIFRNDLLSALRNKSFDGSEIKEILTLMKEDPYLETGEVVTIPLETGKFAKFDVVIKINNDRKLKFDLFPQNEAAEDVARPVMN